ncbi:hypothetical protein DM02DRAFT_733263 [Periconia macrospinosa]|uniref:RBR-type E3 ubiquitin transferase n=1 Tax=Periconia macrospinosa TaxID=97972 RepID=A0A2V1D5F1_9PLEO|nr:hypothetical protein DM02DRAFT_733263 [Periconia macrospinosa]
MGSRFSKILRRPHVTGVVASQAVTTQAGRPHESQLPYRDNDTVTSQMSTSAHNSLSQAADDNALMDIDRSPDSALGNDITSQDTSDSRAASLLNAMRELPGAVNDDINLVEVEPLKDCLICCEKIPRDQVAIEPCLCKNYYCVSCLKNMFLDACKDISRMPPRCCGIIPIHYVRPYLSEEELSRFRLKFEERNTRKPFYCPVQRCSAFIPNRLLPQSKSNKGKERVDSVVGTPNSVIVACPQCEADICTECRNLAHSGSPCEPFKYGLDETTAKLLKRWGYKRCPMCGEGVKRMFGCTHMECRCGAHFCWTCLGPPDDCDDASDDEDYQDNEPVTSAEISPGAEDGKNEEDQIAKLTNLDAGTPDDWAASNLNFGQEPSNEEPPVTGMCEHYFSEHSITLKESLLGTSLTPTNQMECMRCWREIHPTVEYRYRIRPYKPTVVPAGTPASLDNDQHTTRRPHNRAREHTRVERTLPVKRELSGYAASVPDLTAPPVDQLPASIPPRHTNSDWLPAPSNYIVDTYGNIVTTQEPPRKRRRYSVHDPSDLDIQPHQTTTFNSNTAISQPSSSSKEAENPHPHFNMAYRCSECTIIVCSTCKEELDSGERMQQYEELEAERKGVNHWGLVNETKVVSVGGAEDEAMMAAEQMVRLREGDGLALQP